MTHVTFEPPAAVNAPDMSITTQPIHDHLTEAQDLVAVWSQEQPETLVSRKLVIDRLLDLRNIVAGPAQDDIDVILSDVPGVTVVEGRWWNEQLDALETTLSTARTGLPS